MRNISRHLSYANIVATLALFLVLAGGSALAAATLGRNTVGSRQLKSKSVTTGKIASNAVNGSKVANGSLTGDDINVSALGTVPVADHATAADSANTVGGHAASCPAGSTLIRGLCFDTAPTEAPDLQSASEGCAAKGGYLPSPMQLYSAKETLNLGSGVGSDKRFTDDVYSKVGEGHYSTIVIDRDGTIEEQEIDQPSQYICVYPLVR